MSTEAWTSARIEHLLRDRHAPPEWAFFAELQESTGAMGGRAFDAWAMNVWPSKEYVSVGYEIKVSRGDFRREIDDPSKRRPLEAVSNECYFAAPAGLLRPDEIPEGWGLIEATNGDEPRLRIKKNAMQRKIDPLPPRFIAALARRCSDPPEPVPVAAWKLAGRMLRLADLDRLLDARAKRRPAPTVASPSSWQRDQETQAQKELRALQALLAEHFGHRVAYRIDELRRVLSGTAEGGAMDAASRQRLEVLAGELGDLLAGRPTRLRQLPPSLRGERA